MSCTLFVFMGVLVSYAFVMRLFIAYLLFQTLQMNTYDLRLY